MNKKIEDKINKIKELSDEEVCKMYDCSPEEICRGDYYARFTDDTVCPYKVIFGFANFEGSDVTSLGKLQVVLGRKLTDEAGTVTDSKSKPVYLGINVVNSKVKKFNHLKEVYGSCSIGKDFEDFGDLEFLGSNLYLNGTKIRTLKNIQEIHTKI